MADVLLNYVKFLRGTPAAYANLKNKNADTLYFISEATASTGSLYLGNKLIAGSVQETTALSSLSDVNIEILQDKQVLSYDADTEKWIPLSLNSLVSEIPVMTAPGELSPGQAGLVPAPTQDETNYFLRGDGTWAAISEGELNYINSVDETAFEVVEKRLLLKPVEINKVNGLQNVLDNKVNAVYSEDGTAWTLLSPVDKQKLDKLVIDSDGDLAISGSVNAENVEGLSEWIISKRNDIAGLYPVSAANKLDTIAEGAEVNFIKSVNTDEFTVSELGHLELKAVPANKVTGMTELQEKTNALEQEVADLQGRMIWQDMEE